MLDHSKSAIVSFDSDLYGTFNVWTDEKGREYFRALDACAALKFSNVSQSLKRYVDPDYIIKIDDGSHRAGGTNYLSEPGLYQLIFASKTDWAKQFQRWVFEEVLPKLRASGGYIMPTATSEQIEALVSERDAALKEAEFHRALSVIGFMQEAWNATHALLLHMQDPGSAKYRKEQVELLKDKRMRQEEKMLKARNEVKKNYPEFFDQQSGTCKVSAIPFQLRNF